MSLNNNSQARTKPSAWPRIRALISKYPNPITALSAFRLTMPIGELRQILPELNGHPGYRKFITPTTFPPHLRTMARTGIPPGPLENQLAWGAAALEAYGDEIADFLATKSDFECDLFAGRYSEAAVRLEALGTRHGWSLWRLESEILLRQARDGRDAQKAFADALHVDPETDRRATLLGTWYSLRATQSMGPREFRRFLDDKVPPEGPGAKHLHLALGFCPSLIRADVAPLLAMAEGLPVFDRYLLFIATLQAALACRVLSDQDCGSLVSALGGLAARTGDPALARLLVVAGGSPPRPPLGSEFMAFIDAYAIADDGDGAAAARQELDRRPGVDALHMLLRADARTGVETPALFAPDTPAASVQILLHELVRHSPGATEAAQTLERHCTAFANSGWGASLAHLLERPSPESESGPSGRGRIFAALRVDLDCPFHAHAFRPLGASERYLLERFPDQPSPAVAAEAAILAGDPTGLEELPLPPGRRVRLEAACRLYAGEAAEAATELEAVFETAADPITFFEIGVPLVHALLRAGRLADCATRVAQLVVRSRYLGAVLPIRPLIRELLKADEDGRLSALTAVERLGVTIVFDIYAHFVGPDREAERADAFRDLLQAAGVKHASELATMRSDLPLDQMSYFFRNVCLPEVLDQSRDLMDSRAVEDERARILIMLTEESETGGAAEYVEELRQIRTRRAVREINRHVSQSKVYVNVDGLRKAIDVRLREDWQQYKLVSTQPTLHATVDDVIEASESLPEALRPSLMDDRLTRFTNMVKSVRNLFANSSDYGLDANLSTNIRHGYVRRELRNPLVERKLIMNRVSDEGPYRENTHWLGQLPPTSPEREQLARILDQFAGRIDASIDWLNYELLRIHHNIDAPQGLFDYHIKDRTLVVLEEEAQGLETADEFLDQVIEFLWGLTDAALELVRHALHHKVLNRLFGALGGLEAELEAAGLCEALPDLRKAITEVRPEMEAAIGRVANWFTRSDRSEYSDYTLQAAFEAAHAAIRSDYSHLRIRTSFAGDDLTLQGYTLPAVVGVLVILLENAAQYCGNIEDLDVDAIVHLEGNDLTVKVRNSLAPCVDLGAIRQEIGRINADYGAPAVSRFTRVEGRSGYPKIWKLLTHDLLRTNVVQALLDDENRFVAEILVDAHDLIA